MGATVAMTAECPPSRRRHLVVDSNCKGAGEGSLEAGLGGPSSSAPRPGRGKFYVGEFRALVLRRKRSGPKKEGASSELDVGGDRGVNECW